MTGPSGVVDIGRVVHQGVRRVGRCDVRRGCVLRGDVVGVVGDVLGVVGDVIGVVGTSLQK